MKARILTHMNADHALSLRLYLMHYSHVPSSGTTTANMVDMTNEHMIITSSYGRHVVAFEPPMKSLIEARERLVAMHNTCLEALDRSDVVVDKYVPPDRLWQYLVGVLCVLIYATFPFRESLKPGSDTVAAKIWSLGGLAPWLGKLAYALAPAVLGFVVLAHSTEAVWLANGRLKRHWVEFGSVTWWCWVVDCFLEGGGCLMRFDKVVKAKESARKGGKH